jgi:hypothetical protein
MIGLVRSVSNFLNLALISPKINPLEATLTRWPICVVSKGLIGKPKPCICNTYKKYRGRGAVLLGGSVSRWG